MHTQSFLIGTQYLPIHKVKVSESVLERKNCSSIFSEMHLKQPTIHELLLFYTLDRQMYCYATIFFLSCDFTFPMSMSNLRETEAVISRGTGHNI